MKKKAAKRKPKHKHKRIGNMTGEVLTWKGNVYTVMTFDTLQDGRFEQVELKAVRPLPIS